WSTITCACTSGSSRARVSHDPAVRHRRQLLAGVDRDALVAAFRRSEVDRDFARIREAGGELVRFFLLWEDFQPAPRSVSDRSLAHLVTVADTARRHDLRIIPTLFTGHMSGANFIPEWALAGGAESGRFRVIADDRVVEREMRNWYTDPLVFDAHALLARECARALAGHPALWAWDLGNESSNCCVPPTSEDGARWLDRIA